MSAQVDRWLMSAKKNYQASIHSWHQHAFVGSLIAEAQNDERYDFWLGLRYSNRIELYFWSDQSSADYFAWSQNQPDGLHHVNILRNYLFIGN